MDPPFIVFFDNDEFGSSVAVSADARTIMIGAPGCSQAGYVKVYRAGGDSLSGNTVQLGDTSYGNATGGDQLGRSEDITADGNTIVIGSPGFWRYSDRPGYVRISSLKFNDIGLYYWKQIGHIDGEANGDEFLGWSVSVSGDGKTIAVGAPGADVENGDNPDHVRVFRMDDSQYEWIHISHDIEGEAAYDNLGWPVSLSAVGNKPAIGAPWNDRNGTNSGVVKVYQMHERSVKCQ
jgi:hypothetical protein